MALIVLALIEKQFPSMNSNVEAAFFNLKSQVLAKKGQHQEAAAALAKSREVAARLKAPMYLAESDLSAGVVNLFAGQHQEACEYLDQALRFFRSSGLKRDIALTQKYRAAALAALGRYEEGSAAQEQARRLFLELGDAVTAAEV